MGCCASLDQASDNRCKSTLEKEQSPESFEQTQTVEAQKRSAFSTAPNQAGSQELSDSKSKVPKLDLSKVPNQGNEKADKNNANQNKPNMGPNAGANGEMNMHKLVQKDGQRPQKDGNQVTNPNDIHVDLSQGGNTNATQMSNDTATGLTVSPDIFVSLKKGHINDYYKIGRTLGQGAYGKVYQVYHRTTEIARAMKQIKKRSVIKEEEEKLFAEVSILKTLDHPNIVKLYELFQDDSSYYLITEFCTGGELFDRIQQMRSFSEKIAAEYMKQILSAIVYCHTKKIVHRDLKPENLLLDSAKPDASLKVIDFGTSKKFKDGAKMTQKLGTAYYIAPEVLNKNYDEKCDVWSCGVIMYILLCGYPPFGGPNDKEILKRVKIGKFKFDDEEWGKISNDAKNLIRKMLTYDPRQRISALEALNDKWIQKNSSTSQLDTKAIVNLGQFRAKNKLKQAILTFIVTQVTSQQEKEELQKTFLSLDKDGNGVLTKDELIEGWKRVFGEDANMQDVEEIIEKVDINKSGQIDFTEFIMASMNREKLFNKQKLDQAFRIFDLDNDGFITKNELQNVMGGIELDEDSWNKLVKEVDSNCDGKISRDEFVNLLTKIL